jgi:hypothetical protein
LEEGMYVPLQNIWCRGMESMKPMYVGEGKAIYGLLWTLGCFSNLS